MNDRIKIFFPELIKKRDKYIELNLSATITFLGVFEFQERLRKYKVSDELLDNPNSFYEKYYFKSFRSDFLEHLMEKNNSKTFLSFSKPVNDFLLIELTNFNPELYQGRKFGKGMDMFFKFDKMGLIEHVEFAGAAYN